MTIQVALNHVTRYRYDRLINLGPHVVRLRPAVHSRTRVLAYSLKVTPEDHFINWQQDPHGNWLARLVFHDKADQLAVEVDLVAEMAVLNPFDFFVESAADIWPFDYTPSLKKELLPFLETETPGPLMAELIASVPREPTNTIDFIVDLNRRLHGMIGYVVRMEPGIQSCEETLGKRSGSCRDSGWLLVQFLRQLGLAARFVSGYLIQLKADQKALDGPSGTEADFTDLHAWAEVFLPGAGWIGLDPTSGLLAGEGHIPLAATPDPGNAAPINGTHDRAEVAFEFAMKIERIKEAPRVTLPYSEAQWASIDALGQALDQRLVAEDVRLTMGGEPTFVGLDDRDEPEWNTAAVGPTKRRFGDALIRRLAATFAPGGLLQHGQGKWYPGEPLPRWAFAVYWRSDREPLWGDPSLIAQEAPASVQDSETLVETAGRFAGQLAANLELDPGLVTPAFEDTAQFVLREQQLPGNVDPLDSKLEDAEERARLVRVFSRGLTTPTSYVLPIQACQAQASPRSPLPGRRRFRWKSERWATRRGGLFLIPGDSPAGFRLPLGALDHLQADDYPHVLPMDPFAAHAALPAREPVQQPRTGEAAFQPVPRGAGLMPGGPVRTALTVEPRDGHLYVFLPPVESADEFVDLVAAVEETALAMGQPVRLEGYPPPPDPRLKSIKVTPDPGVIEVNIHPAASWAEQVAITETIYEEARQARLDTAKFMVDGRPTGTGGGNHIVVGGATPADSPFLRRPDLLASIIRYWQNHPSLSYLFSGLFIGPTSQAPRVDEARQDQLYELEIALARVPDPLHATAVECPPWLVDRLFRNLLVDLTGNTHRAEICIDKLYSPDGPAGRLGLVEFRGFEMPPHPRMSLAQGLLLRALIAWFWARPYTERLVRHGTGLHDRFMLPHYVWADFNEVLADLEGAGMAFEPAWFLPHLEFRFPLYGQVEVAGIEIEIRAALEPWHVLGEEATAGGTARYVDSSLERIQVRVAGDRGERHVVTCNGYTLPLSRTGDGHEVAGVRFRAWQPPSALHPTIPVHSPLVLDVVDAVQGRSLGGCTYHVMHPGGRAFDTAPVNDFEAQGRRLARFQPMGHTPGPMHPIAVPRNPSFPHTLDLRRVGY